MNIQLTATNVEITLEWHERLWACHLGQMIVIPLNHIARVSTELPALPWYTLRAPGTAIPGLFAAGTFYTPFGREFWYVMRQSSYLVLALEDEYYKRIVLSIDDPHPLIAQFRALHGME